MKMVVAVIRPEKVDDVVDALEAVNVPGVTITDVRGRGEQGGVETIIKTIREHARTGKKGDGRIFVLPVEAAAWVRTDDFITG